LLTDDQIKWIFNLTNKGFHGSLNKIFMYSRSHLTNYLFDPNNLKCQYTGKLGLVKDPELKLRVIAMVDYLSQCILRPIHDGLLSALRKLPSDRTFTQNPFKDWPSSEESFYSLDLSAATDRFPVGLQAKFLSLIFVKGLNKTRNNLLAHN